MSSAIASRPHRARWYGLEEPGGDPIEAWIDVDGWIRWPGSGCYPSTEVPLPGRHMLSNVLGASLAASLAGAAAGSDRRGDSRLPRRRRTGSSSSRERDGVRWVNDSQATIPVAAIAALEAFEAPIVLIAGGKDKGLAYDAFADAIAAPRAGRHPHR